MLNFIITIIAIVIACLCLPVQAISPLELFQYYQNNHNILANKWIKKAPSSRDPAKLMMTSKAVSPHQLHRKNVANKFSNRLEVESHVEKQASLQLPPVNPAPMLHPNPFANSAGMQFDFTNVEYMGRSSGSASAPLRREGDFCRRSFDGRSGYCIVAYHCLHVVKDYRVHGTKMDVCSYRKNIPVICCPLADKLIGEQRISATKCQEYHNALKNIKLDLARNFTGKPCVPSVPMIVGGEVTGLGEYPHMAALGWTQETGKIRWGCGGTLISDRYVLSAAHCATSSAKPPDLIRLGSQHLDNAISEQQDHKIRIIILHPKYRSSSYYHDIALLKLIKPLQFSTFVKPACLWQLPDIDIHTATAAGWGGSAFLGHPSEDLKKVDLDLIDQTLCKNIYHRERRLPRGIIDEQFCAGQLEGGKDTCQGDSGGPLHAELHEFKCVKFVVGITSFGKFCGTPNAPGVYTKIFSYLDWIEKIVFAS